MQATISIAQYALLSIAKSLRAVGQTELSCAWDQDTWDHNNLEEYVIDLFLEELSI